MTAYNPQLRFELSEITPEGLDVPFAVDFLEGLDPNYHAGNAPLHVTANISSSIGGTQNTASVVINNTPYIETFRRNPQAELAKFQGKKLRLRIWAWYHDNGTTAKSAQPNYPPVFVGDMLEGFTIGAKGINDSALRFTAQGHAWFAGSGKYRMTWPAKTNYLTIVQDIGTYIVGIKQQGKETQQSAPHVVIDDFDEKLLKKELDASFSVHRNPMEVLNDICKQTDMVCGFHNNIPYIVSKDRPFQKPWLPIGLEHNPTAASVDVSGDTGMLSLINYGMLNFGFTHNYDPELYIGRVVTAFDEPQIGIQSTYVAGRISAIDIALDNVNGHRCEVNCSYLKEFDPLAPTESKVVLPEKRADNNGLKAT